MSKSSSTDRNDESGKAEAAAGATKARRGFGLQAIAKTLPKVTKQALGRRGFAEADLLAAWMGIVGRDIAARCVPRKLNRPRPGHSGEGVLTLRVEAGCALEIQHLEPQLLERINGYFGFRAVGRLRLLQVPALAAAPARPPVATNAPDADTAAEAALRGRLAEIGDGDLRAALDRLGHAVLSRGG